LLGFLTTPNSIKIHFSDLKWKILEPTDNLSDFDCSKNDIMKLNEFIHKEALDYQKENLGVTYLFLYQGKIVGFATLAMGNIEIKRTKHSIPFSTTIKDFPALVIARLGVDNNFRWCDIGKNICFWCLSLSQELLRQVGCVLVIALTCGQNAITFYRKCEFLIEPKHEYTIKFDDRCKVLVYQIIPR